MIAHFPDPYPDELLYSTIARFAERMRYPALYTPLLELFGDRHGVPAVELPNKLDRLVSSLPRGCGYTSDFIIQNNTLLPFYAPFLPGRNLDRVIANMKSDTVRTTQLHAGIVAGGIVPPQFFKSCPNCDRENIKRYGETYWIRHHQIKGVEVCPKHRMFLESSNVRLRGLCPKDSLVSAQSAQRVVLPRKIDLKQPAHRALLRMAESAIWLLKQNHLKTGLVQINSEYRRVLEQQGFIGPNGRIRCQLLRDKINKTFSQEWLTILNCELQKRGDGGWLGRLLRETEHAIAPLRHLVVMAALDISAEEFFTEILTAPTIKPPVLLYPCLNKICPQAGRFIIDRFEAKRAKVGRSRIFECPHCGHRSSRVTEGDSIIRVIDFGRLWKEKLRSLWAGKNLKLSFLASELNADIRSVQNGALQLGLEFPRVGPGRMTPRPKPRRLGFVLRILSIQDRRSDWYELRKANPDAGISDLHRLSSALYNWLYRHDREWMLENSPQCKRHVPKNDQVDWAAHDKEIVERVIATAIRIKNSSGKPKRATTRSIGLELGIHLLLQMQKDKLPATKAALAANVESTEQFILRRVRWTVETLKKGRGRVNRSDITRVAGIAARALQIPSIREAVDCAKAELDINSENSPISEAA